MATQKQGKRKPAKQAKAPVKARRAVRRKRTAAPKLDHEALMAAWQRAMTPSEGHRRLEPMVGRWRTRTTFTMAHGAPPEVSEGNSEHRWVLGGRYVEQRYAGTSMGMPFEGIGYTGYDNVQRKYIGTWMDSFGTGFMPSIGVGRPKDGAIAFLAEAHEPSGRLIRFDCRLRIQDQDHHTYEMWAKAPGGKRYRMMIVEYTRA